MKMTRLAAERPSNRCRTRANAIRVPRTVAATVASSPIWMLRLTAWHMLGSAQGCSQFCRVKASNL